MDHLVQDLAPLMQEYGYAVLALAIAVEGLGIAFLPDWVAGDDINSGALVQLFPELASQPHMSTGIYALRALRHPPARVTVFLDALREFIGHPAKWSTLHCQV